MFRQIASSTTSPNSSPSTPPEGLESQHGSSSALVYRPDIDGLRALAVLAVVLFHAGFGLADGGFVGVDVFFVVSGYLIGGLLLAELDRTGRIDVLAFWARRTRRLLPSALLVIAATLSAAMVLLPTSAQVSAARDAIYAALYLTNWQNLLAALDYFGDDKTASLFIHYWSLAVEEQFYLFLTAVFVIAVALGRVAVQQGGGAEARVRAARIAIALLLSASLASLIANLVAVVDAQPVAFFGTHTRVWQLGVGVAICLLARGGYAPPWGLRIAAIWTGLSLVCGAILIYDGDLIYPGAYAIVPTLGTALILLAGLPDRSAGRACGNVSAIWPIRILASAGPVAIGKVSYALYLWHWPVFQLYKATLDAWGTLDRVAAIGITAVLAWASTRWVETPIRFHGGLARRAPASLVGAVALTGFVGAAALALHADRAATPIVLGDGSTLSADAVRGDLPRLYADGCHVDQADVTPSDCVYGATDGVRRVVLFGDSHAAQWFPALEAIARRRGWALIPHTKSACAGVDIALWNARWKRPYAECSSWREAVLADIERTGADLVVLANLSAHKPYLPQEARLAEGEEIAVQLAAAERRTVARLTATGVRVVRLADTPLLPDDPVTCLIDRSVTGDACRWALAAVLPDQRFPWSETATSPTVDLVDHLCPNGVCAALQGASVTMRDTHHLTANYAATLGAPLEAALDAALAGVDAASLRTDR